MMSGLETASYNQGFQVHRNIKFGNQYTIHLLFADGLLLVIVFIYSLAHGRFLHSARLSSQRGRHGSLEIGMSGYTGGSSVVAGISCEG